MKRQPRERKFPMGFKKLEEITSKESDEIVLQLVNEGSGFPMLLQQTTIRDDLMCLIIVAIGKACKTRHRSNLMAFLTIVQSSIYFKQHLANFIIRLKDSPRLQIRFCDDLLEQLLNFFSTMLETYPTTASEDLMLVMFISQEAVNHVKKLEYLKTTLEVELLRVEAERSKLAEQNKKKELPSAKKMADEEPPNSFREVSVIPTAEDLRSNVLPFVRPNVIDGQYSSPEHYLDVQFRLLREDFVSPLREGIEQYLANQRANRPVSRLQEIRVYEDVHVIHSVCVPQGIAYVIQFDADKLKHIRWEASKRLIYGSLLCLSRDDFQTAIFATVVNRDTESLKEGFIQVRFENPSIRRIPQNEAYVMVEAQAYFEAYRHILQALKRCQETDLPFQDYLINVSPDMKAPTYLNGNVTYDLRPLVMKSKRASEADDDSNDDSDIEFESDIKIQPLSLRMISEVPVKNYRRWPTAEECNLDSSQWKAIQSALTRQLALIQGPPGTGKTFIGLKIVQTLLHNRSKWGNEHDPILIVCFTNHALDQFLEGIVKFTKSVIRIGGRSTSEVLKDYNMRSVRSKRRKTKKLPQEIFFNWRSIYARMISCKDAISVVGKHVARTFKGIVHEKLLSVVMSTKQESSLSLDGFQSPGGHSHILEWLCVASNARVDEADLEYALDDDTNEEDTTEDNEEIAIDEEADMEIANRLLEGDEDVDMSDSNNESNSEDEDEETGGNILALDFNEVLRQDYMEEKEAADEEQWQTYGLRRKILRRELRKKDAMSEADANKIRCVWDLALQDRWRLYRYWVAAYREKLNEQARDLERSYEEETRRLQEMKEAEDLINLREAKVIGLTTTGTARLHTYLEALQPSIVVVEEAAEVLEAHIVTALTRHCKHLILIGDHQQLRPNPTVYRLAKEFNLDVSLFERLIKNGVAYDQLELQHRMRPEIASLLVPHIYPSLKNHSSVLNYDSIRGVETNMFFITHTVPESSVMDTQSKINEYEVKYLVELCRYFRQHDYDATQITILTMYLGQLFLFKKHMKKKIFQGVRVTAVDNYQGEENDIILLSLVRSNVEGNIGFVKIANRICVALSRAKKGFFVIGNFQVMAHKEKLWQRIITQLEQTKSIGPALNVVCDNHPNIKTLIETPEDFNRVREGGCRLPCEFRFDCGHQCPSVCHVTDKAHAEKKCKKRCLKKCSEGHQCLRTCGEDCGRCMHKTEKFLFKCLHTVEVPCYMDRDDIECNNLCEQILQCGHSCQNKCFQACTLICKQTVTKKVGCGHEVSFPCFMADEPDWKIAKKCTIKCKTTLVCDHPCPGTCGNCLGGKIHMSCTKKCERILVCGHSCLEPCAASCPPCTRTCETRCPHTKCPHNCGYPCVSCQEPCTRECKHGKCTNLCGELCNMEPCNEPCKKLLKCRHACIGLCGEPCPTKCRKCNRAEVTTLLFGYEDEPDARFIQLEDCGHVVEVRGLDKWMKQVTRNTANHEAIMMKFCPICKTVIQRSSRYGNLIKNIALGIINIKREEYYGQGINLEEKRRSIIRTIARGQLYSFFNWLERDPDLKKYSYAQLTVLENQINFCETMKKLLKKLTKLPDDDDLKFITEEMDFIGVRLKSHQFKFSEQELTEISWEIQRLAFFVQLKEFIDSIGGLKNCKQEVKAKFEEARSILTDFNVFRDEREQKANNLIKEINQLQGGLGISNEERLQIVKALGLRQGHWYKCPNGHYYAVGDCGTPMQQSLCPTCRKEIGGNVYLAANNVRADDVMLAST